MKKEKYEKILKTYANIYIMFSWVSENIVLCLILNHFKLLNGFTSFIVLLTTIFSNVFIYSNSAKLKIIEGEHNYEK